MQFFDFSEIIDFHLELWRLEWGPYGNRRVLLLLVTIDFTKIMIFFPELLIMLRQFWWTLANFRLSVRAFDTNLMRIFHLFKCVVKILRILPTLSLSTSNPIETFASVYRFVNVLVRSFMEYGRTYGVRFWSTRTFLPSFKLSQNHSYRLKTRKYETKTYRRIDLFNSKNAFFQNKIRCLLFNPFKFRDTVFNRKPFCAVKVNRQYSRHRIRNVIR